MAFKKVKGGVCAPIGFSGGAVSCGIKDPENPRPDLALVYSKHPCVSAGTFTSNRVKAAPVKVTQSHLRARELRAIVANSGNANACTGVPGIEDARTMAKAVAATLGLRQREVGVCS
ncbi:MAG: bifunctional ornithine acetyltransferase/N-acetylglutamate synthase, partial [Verrucomicrobiota bacterium]|nr:bifunctional ornithine acetyltransferase/N-acetylglutamate synthase [Verrucomicrobiota bacterium]